MTSNQVVAVLVATARVGIAATTQIDPSYSLGSDYVHPHQICGYLGPHEYGLQTASYDTIRDAILTCARKPT